MAKMTQQTKPVSASVKAVRDVIQDKEPEGVSVTPEVKEAVKEALVSQASDPAPSAPPAPAPAAAPQAGAPTALAATLHARRVIMVRQFMPQMAWITENVLSKAQGARVKIGRVWGVALSIEDKATVDRNGMAAMETTIKGMFRSEDALTGKTSEAPSVVLLSGFTNHLRKVLKTVPVVQLDCDIELEATGTETAPFSLVLTARIEGEDEDCLSSIRNRKPAQV